MQEHLANFRRAGIVDFSAIRDDGPVVEEPLEYSSPEHFLETAERLAQEGQGVRLEGQPEWIEVWCEAAGMVPQLARVVGEYGVSVYSSGGFDSVTSKYEAAQRIAARDVPTVVLHVGDHDPSGLALFEAAAEDVEAFALAFASEDVRFERVAVTVEQIERYQLPTAPAKAKDKRSAWVGGGTVQAEALPPDVLAEEVRQAVIAELDMDVFGEAQETEAVTARRSGGWFAARGRRELEEGNEDGAEVARLPERTAPRSSIFCHHRKRLRSTPLSPRKPSAPEAGFPSPRDARPARFGRSLRYIPTLVAPIHGVVADEPPWYMHRPDDTPVKGGRPRKYLIPFGMKMALNIQSARAREPGERDPAVVRDREHEEGRPR